MTEAIGVFNFAESYRRAAKTLLHQDELWTHSSSPINFLFYHSCELYLKSYLWIELGPSKLRRIGHDLRKLHTKAREHNLPPTPWADYAVEYLDVNIAISERYLQTGYCEAQMTVDAWSYLSAELCLATVEVHLNEYPILRTRLNLDGMLDAEKFQLPEELGGPPSIQTKAMADLEKLLSEEDK